VRLNLGAGTKPKGEGWTSVDIAADADIRADVRHLPLADGSAERIFAAHLCEHLPLPDLEATLREWRRVLAPDGVMMLVGPDIDRAVRQGEPGWLLEAIIAHGDGPSGHAWTCSETVLVHFLQTVGWAVSPQPVGQVRPPEWPNAEPDAAWQYALVCT